MATEFPIGYFGRPLIPASLALAYGHWPNSAGLDGGRTALSCVLGARPHPSSGALVADSATVAGNAARDHHGTGSLLADAATITGDGHHLILHATDGTLVADAATIAATSFRNIPHPTSGALTSDSATLIGFAGIGVLSTETKGWIPGKKKRRNDEAERAAEFKAKRERLRAQIEAAVTPEPIPAQETAKVDAPPVSAMAAAPIRLPRQLPPQVQYQPRPMPPLVSGHQLPVSADPEAGFLAAAIEHDKNQRQKLAQSAQELLAKISQLLQEEQ